jgi:hypothetical protein
MRWVFFRILVNILWIVDLVIILASFSSGGDESTSIESSSNGGFTTQLVSTLTIYAFGVSTSATCESISVAVDPTANLPIGQIPTPTMFHPIPLMQPQAP